jgi:hypothetical protein
MADRRGSDSLKKLMIVGRDCDCRIGSSSMDSKLPTVPSGRQPYYLLLLRFLSCLNDSDLQTLSYSPMKQMKKKLVYEQIYY